MNIRFKWLIWAQRKFGKRSKLDRAEKALRHNLAFARSTNMKGFYQCLSLLFLFLNPISGQNTQQWSISLSDSNKKPLHHFWNQCVGSGHGSLALREDWQNQMKNAHEKIGFTSVRFHGPLDDDVGVVNGPGLYSFVNIDKIYDFLLSIEMKP